MGHKGKKLQLTESSFNRLFTTKTIDFMFLYYKLQNSIIKIYSLWNGRNIKIYVVGKGCLQFHGPENLIALIVTVTKVSLKMRLLCLINVQF